MTDWPPNPILYEINAWVWLNTLNSQRNQSITLANIPDDVVDELASYRVDAIWLMGVWQRSLESRTSALNYIHEYQGALPNITADDIIGSAYALGSYEVDKRLGGREGLAAFRRQLHKRGIRLILDFVPNHVATDHPWIKEHPDYFIIGSQDDLEVDPFTFFVPSTSDQVMAHGRDPYFPAWIDTTQLNAFSPGYRQATIDTLLDIASQCDGVRCDMAMLMMTSIFHETWGHYAGAVPDTEYWTAVIPRIKSQHPNFIFLAEVYWQMEYALHLEGFDYTYDKTMYDRLLSGDVEGIRAHLGADMNFLTKNIRFIENHDEPRAADTLGIDPSRPAATVIHTVPGAVLLHDGQFDGRVVKLPVQIKRQPDEQQNAALKAFYLRLLKEVDHPIYQQGHWSLFDVQAGYNNQNDHHQVMAHGWHSEGEYRLIVANFARRWVQVVIDLNGWEDVAGSNWRLFDALHDSYSYQSGDDMVMDGLYLELEASSAHIFHFHRLTKSTDKPA